MTFCKVDCYGSAEVKILITKQIFVKASDVELCEFRPDNLNHDLSQRYYFHLKLFLPYTETKSENWILSLSPSHSLPPSTRTHTK
jgi:hypothetical protein